MSKRETVAENLERWLEVHIRPKSPKTYETYEVQVRLHIIPSIGHIRLSKLLHSDVQQMLNGISSSKHGGGLGPHSVQQTQRVLRTALAVAVRDKKLDLNPVTGTTTPRLPEPDVTTWTPEQARTFLAYTRQHRLYALYVLSLATGLRQGEAIGLRWEDVDLDTATLTPRQQLQRGRLSPLKTKGSGKPIAIAGFVVDAFRAHRDHQQFECSAGDMGLVFTEWNGAPLVARDLRRDFKRHVTEAGVPVIVWHAMRHYAATFFTTETMAPRQVAATLLRHSPAMLDRYSHTRIEQQREPVEAMGQALAGG